MDLMQSPVVVHATMHNTGRVPIPTATNAESGEPGGEGGAWMRARGEERLVRVRFWIRMTQGKEIKKERNGEKEKRKNKI
jgi:hypothetical protein